MNKTVYKLTSNLLISCGPQSSRSSSTAEAVVADAVAIVFVSYIIETCGIFKSMACNFTMDLSHQENFKIIKV